MMFKYDDFDCLSKMQQIKLEFWKFRLTLDAVVTAEDLILRATWSQFAMVS